MAILARGIEKLFVDGRRRLKRSLTKPYAGPGLVPEFDPKQPPPPPPRALPYDPHLVPAFTACHLLAFGTSYGIYDYRREAELRLFAREHLDFGTGNAAGELHAEAELIDAVEDGFAARAAGIYARAKRVENAPVSQRLQTAAQVLMEAARRGEVTVDANAPGSPEHERVTLCKEDFLGRRDFYFWREELFVRDPNEFVVEFVRLCFRPEEVRLLRRSPWHGLFASDQPPEAAAAVRKSSAQRRTDAKASFAAFLRNNPTPVRGYEKEALLAELCRNFQISQADAARARQDALDEAEPETRRAWTARGRWRS